MSSNVEHQVAEDYKSALADLHVNSKPLITMLTMLADENKMYASVITHVVACHIKETSYKLPAMYLVDSIVKNVGNDYKRLFGNAIASIFTGVFKEVDERTRKKLYELRQTWNEVFAQSRLFLLDTNIHEIDPAWPITSQPRIVSQTPTIHVNPNKFKPHTLKTAVPLQSGIGKMASQSSVSVAPMVDVPSLTVPSTKDIEELKKVQTEKRVLEETRKKVEKMIESESAPVEISGKMVEPRPSALQAPPDRQEFLRKYKIKKKSQPGADKSDGPLPHRVKEKVSNIHIAPWKVQQILPGMTPPTFPSPPSHKERRPVSVPARPTAAPARPTAAPAVVRDPRKGQQEQVKDSRHGTTNLEPTKAIRDPRLATARKTTPPTIRDPRLISKPQESSSGARKPSPSPVSAPTVLPKDPRVALTETKKPEKEKIKHEKEYKERKEKEPQKAKELSPLKKENDNKEDKDKEKEKKKEKEKLKEKERDKEKEKSKERERDKEKEKSKEMERDKEKEKPKEGERDKDKSSESEREKSKEREKNKVSGKDKKKHSSPKVSNTTSTNGGIDITNKENVKEKSSKLKEKEKGSKSLSSSSSSESSSSMSSPSKSSWRTSSSSSSSSNSSKSKSEAKHTKVAPVSISSSAPENDKKELAPASSTIAGPESSPGSIRTKRREHIRPRVESPEDDVKPDTKTLKVEVDSTTPSSSDVAAGKTTKRTKGGGGASESDDSDHYDGNKPRPTVYATKKAKTEPTNPSLAQATAPPSNPFETLAIDTDLRLFTPLPERRPTEVKQKDKLGGLFGTEDTDLRQLPARFPQPQTPLPGVIHSFMGKPDEDMRVKAAPRKAPPEGDENQDPRLRGIIKNDKDKYIESQAKNTAQIVAELRAKKAIFSSPHAAKWEKFREKNPEFREYQRQASVCEKMEGVEEVYPLDRESPGLFGRGRSGRPGNHRRIQKDDDRSEFVDRKTRSPSESESGDENYQYLILQLQDQMNKGDISHGEYGKCMESIRLMVEKRKIMELQAKERDSSGGRAGWSEERKPLENSAPGSGGGSWAREYSKSRQNERYQRNQGDAKREEVEISKQGPGWGYRHESRRNFSSRDPEDRPQQRFGDEWTGEPDLPVISEDVLRSVCRESETRTIDIDAKPREIRTYGERAVILMDWNDPRVLSFESSQCNIVFDEGQFVITMAIGEEYREFMIDGEKHRVKPGVPTQELMIDGKGYQCFFGGKPITVHLAGKNRTISLDGRPPKVSIGSTLNSDYLLGKIELIINARKIVFLYLDAKPQRFTIDGLAFVIKFIDAFQAVTINGVRFPVEFGGLPICFSVRGYRQFLRFSRFPDFAVPGKISVRGMDSDGNTLIPSYPPSPPPYKSSNTGVESETSRGKVQPPIDASRVGSKPPIEVPRLGVTNPTAEIVRGVDPQPIETSRLGIVHPNDMSRVGVGVPVQSETSRGVPPAFPLPGVQIHPTPAMPPGVVSKPVLKPPPAFPTLSLPTPASTYPQVAPPPFQMPLGIIHSAPPPMAGVIPGSYLTNSGGTAIPQAAPIMPLPNLSIPPPVTTASAPATAAVPSTTSAPVDVLSLLDRLVKTGIIGGKKDGGGKKEVKKDSKKDAKEGANPKEEDEEEDLEIEIDDLKDLPPSEVMWELDNLRKRNQKMVKKMHRGIQCSSCGLRYPADQTQQYSHHLDWHFRMNKKQQDSTKKVSTRKFYLCFDDWIQYEEIEDVDERVPSMFEVDGQSSAKEGNDDEDDEEDIPSVAVSSDHSLGVCPICHETFDQFYHHNTEEWHYKYAIQAEGINYHPGCHQDHLKALKQEEERLKKEAEEEERKKKEAEEEERRKKEEAEEKEKEEKKDVKVSEVEEANNDDVEEIKVEDKIEDEEIQEIEKVKDETPKEEIDLTNEDDKIPELKEEEKDKKQIKDDKVLAVIRKMSLLSNGLPSSLHIKEEPIDQNAEMSVLMSHKDPPILPDIPIKMEIEEQPSEPQSFDIDDDDVNESEFGGETPNESWITPTPLDTAHTDIASSIDGNTELLNRDENSQETTVPKIKISVSIPTQNNIIEEHQNAINNINSEEGNETENSTEMNNNFEEFVPPAFTVDYELKPLFRGVSLREQPVAQRGMEVSSLCSIM